MDGPQFGISTEIHALVRLLVGEDVWAGSITTARLLALLERHRLVPQAYQAVRQHLRSDNSELDAAFAASVYNSLGLTAELCRIAAAFDQADVPFLVIKGPVLAKQYYGGPEQRQYKDLDLFVPRGRLIAATRVLSDYGYQGLGCELLTASSRRVRRYMRRTCDTAFFRRIGDSLHQIELHWRLDRDARVVALPFDEIWQRGSEVQLGNRTVKTLPPMEQLAYVAFHGGKHRWKRLCWLWDLRQGIKSTSNLDVDHLFHVARQLHADRHLAAGLYLLRALERHTGIEGNSSILDQRMLDSHLSRHRGLHRIARGASLAMQETPQWFETTVSHCNWNWRVSGVRSASRQLIFGLSPPPGDLLTMGVTEAYWNRWRTIARRIARTGRAHATVAAAQGRRRAA